MDSITDRGPGLKNLRFKDGFGTVVFLLTLYMTSVLAFSSSPELNIYSHLLFFVSFGGCAVYLNRNHGRLHFSPYMFYLLLFIMWCVVTMLWAEDAGKSFEMVVTLTELLISSVILFSFLVSVGNVDFFLISMFVAGMLGSFYMLGYYGFSGYMEMLKEGERAGQEISNVNVIGMYMAIAVLIGFYLAYIKGKLYCYVLIALPLVMALGSGSRKVLVILVVGISLMLLLDSVQKFDIKKFVRIAIIVIILIVVAIWISEQSIFNTIFERFEQMTGATGKVDGSTLKRQKMIVAGWKYFKEHPFTGTGINNAGVMTKKAIGWETYLHNNFVELLATTGIIGFTFYYAVYVYLVFNLFKNYRKTHNPTTIFLLSLLITRTIIEYGAVTYYDKMNMIYLTAAAVDVCITKRKLKEQKREYYEQSIRES